MSRIDWTAIKQRVNNDTLLFVLDRHWQQLLLSVCENYKWEATFRVPGYDYADWDTLQGVVEQGTFDLMGGVMLSDILGYIDDIETLLTAILNKPAAGCCPPDGVLTNEPVPDEEPNDWTSDGETYPETYAGTTMTSAAEYHAYLCAAAVKLVDNLAQQLRNTSDTMQAGLLGIGLLASFLATLITGGAALPLSVTLIAAIWSGIHAVWESGVFDEPIADLEDSRSLLICAALQNDYETFAAAVETVVGEIAWTAFFQFLPYNNMIASLFTGTVNGENIAGLVPDYDSCVCEPVYDFDQTYTFDANSEGWGIGYYSQWLSSYSGNISIYKSGGEGYTDLAPSNIDDAVYGVGQSIQVVKVNLQLTCHWGAGSVSRVIVQANNQADVAYIDSGVGNYAPTMQDVEITFDPATEMDYESPNIAVRLFCDHISGGDARWYITSVRVRGWNL